MYPSADLSSAPEAQINVNPSSAVATLSPALSPDDGDSDRFAFPIVLKEHTIARFRTVVNATRLDSDEAVVSIFGNAIPAITKVLIGIRVLDEPLRPRDLHVEAVSETTAHITWRSGLDLPYEEIFEVVEGEMKVSVIGKLSSHTRYCSDSSIFENSRLEDRLSRRIA